MNSRKQSLTLLPLALLLAMGGCHHVAFTHAPAGTSVNVAMAKRAEAVPTPTPKPPPIAAYEERLAAQDARNENVADYYTMGNLLMAQGKYADAVPKFESAVKLDPTFSDAWNHLAICYQNTGQAKKAAAAFKKYKAVSQQQPQTASMNNGL